MNHNDSIRHAVLKEVGFRNIEEDRPEEETWVDYDLIFMGQRVSGHKQLPRLNLEADNAINPIDAALVLGTGPGIESIYWRPHDMAQSSQDTLIFDEGWWS